MRYLMVLVSNSDSQVTVLMLKEVEGAVADDDISFLIFVEPRRCSPQRTLVELVEMFF